MLRWPVPRSSRYEAATNPPHPPANRLRTAKTGQCIEGYFAACSLFIGHFGAQLTSDRQGGFFNGNLTVSLWDRADYPNPPSGSWKPPIIHGALGIMCPTADVVLRRPISPALNGTLTVSSRSPPAVRELYFPARSYNEFRRRRVLSVQPPATENLSWCRYNFRIVRLAQFSTRA